MILFFFAFLGARSGDVTRRENWRAEHDLQIAESTMQLQRMEILGTTALARGMQAVVETLCDVVFGLSAGWRVQKSSRKVDAYFGKPMEDCKFLDVVQPLDRERVRAMLEGVANTQIPQCLPSTLQLHRKWRVATLTIVSIGGTSEGYLVGVNAESEEVPAEEEWVLDLVPPAVALHEGEKEELQSEAAGSIPSTTPSGCIFGKVKAALSDACAGDQDLIVALERLSSMGGQEHWLLDVDDLEIDRDPHAPVLGRGSFGTVVPASLNGIPVALKVPRATYNARALPALFNELRVLRRLRHPCIVLFLGVCICTRSVRVLLVFERLFGNTLTKEVVPPPDGPSPADRRQMLLEIASALRFLHAQRPNIVHGDVKSDNVFVEHVGSGKRAKLLDFGLACLMTLHAEPFGGTARWRAPETMSRVPGVHPGTPADVFSFGCLIYFTIIGRGPLQDCTPDEVRQLAHQGYVPSLTWPQSSVPLQIEAISLVHTCLTFDPALRPTMDVVQGGLQRWPVF
eukprot:NODE_211_length_1802_cov_341.460790.p1 GENE.NODE_211_length_1802_cov_341.460790~~NODE_211_length_1802_cov_341.460790.p1  ORF type:complete len:551 (-),score=153.60 NODE_211_length_1802_cov_341.460790:132-1670(-)